MIESLGIIFLMIIILIILSYVLKSNEDPRLAKTVEEIKKTAIEKETNNQIFKEYQMVVEKLFKEKSEYSYNEFLAQLTSYNEDFDRLLLLSRFYPAGLVDLVRNAELEVIYRKGKGFRKVENIYPEAIEVMKILKLKKRFHVPSVICNSLQGRIIGEFDSQKRHVGTIQFGVFSGSESEVFYPFNGMNNELFYFNVFSKIDPNYKGAVTTAHKSIENIFYSEPVAIKGKEFSEQRCLNEVKKHTEGLGLGFCNVEGYK